MTKSLRQAAQARMADVHRGSVLMPTSTAIMALYDALLCQLTMEERAAIVDHPSSAPAIMGAIRLGMTPSQTEESARLVDMYYDPDIEDSTRLRSAIALAEEVLRRLDASNGS